jgi:cell division septum initiation protein DivIVA
MSAMPRVTKAQIAAALVACEREKRDLERDLREERFTSAIQHKSLELLHTRAEHLEKENKDLKARVRRGCDRSRSPRMPATSSDAAAAVACKAFAQVGLWQRDSVVEEQKAEIQRLQEEVARLRRGEGPMGEVLAYIDAVDVARAEIERTPERASSMAEHFAKQTMPVHQAFRITRNVLYDTRDFLVWGGPTHGEGARVPRAQF